MVFIFLAYFTPYNGGSGWRGRWEGGLGWGRHVKKKKKEKVRNIKKNKKNKNN